jgi:hypothetical protein
MALVLFAKNTKLFYLEGVPVAKVLTSVMISYRILKTLILASALYIARNILSFVFGRNAA